MHATKRCRPRPLSDVCQFRPFYRVGSVKQRFGRLLDSFSRTSSTRGWVRLNGQQLTPECSVVNQNRHSKIGIALEVAVSRTKKLCGPSRTLRLGDSNLRFHITFFICDLEDSLYALRAYELPERVSDRSPYYENAH